VNIRQNAEADGMDVNYDILSPRFRAVALRDIGMSVEVS
jgi:hypothetical protein